MNDTILYKTAETFIEKDTIAKAAAKEATALKPTLKDAVNESGHKNEDTGHILLVLEDKGKKPIEVKHTCRVSSILRPSAIDVIEETFTREQRRKLIETHKVVRQDVLEEMIQNGEITQEQATKVIAIEETYALTVKYKK